MFTEATAAVGLSFYGESWGNSWGDYNQDGWVDLYVSNHRDPATLFLNQQNGTFLDVTATQLPNIPSDPDPHAATWADFDRDGDLDLLQAGGGGTGIGLGVDTAFYVNDNGHFVDKASELGLSLVQLRGRTPIFYDWNNDGLLDLLITGIGRLDGNDVPSPVYLQTDEGKFEPVTDKAALSTPNFQFGILSDLSGDGNLDLIIEKPFKVYDITEFPFTEIQSTLFQNPPFFGQDYVTGDFDGDLRMDLFVANPTDKLYFQGDDGFEERGVESGLVATGTLNNATAFDYDNDMDLDLYVVTSSEDYLNILYENDGNGKFTIVDNAGGASRTPLGFADTVSTSDVNNDGFLDLYITNGKGAPERYIVDGQLPPNQFFLNEGNDNHWLEVDLDGVYTNIDGIGSRIYATAGGVTQVREHANGLHHRTQNQPIIHFGLAQNTVVDSLKIQWRSGIQQILGSIESDQILKVTEGFGQKGNDLIVGTDEDESFYGQSGDDELDGAGGNDTLRGNAGYDSLLGRDGDDVLIGGGGNDLLVGDQGADKLIGANGSDTMMGGLGADNFVFLRSQDGPDIITDFDTGLDRLTLRRNGFSGALSSGKLPNEQFVIGSAAQDNNDRLVYDANLGQLFFDPDGSGSANQVLLATFSDLTQLNPNQLGNRVRVV